METRRLRAGCGPPDPAAFPGLCIRPESPRAEQGARPHPRAGPAPGPPPSRTVTPGASFPGTDCRAGRGFSTHVGSASCPGGGADARVACPRRWGSRHAGPQPASVSPEFTPVVSWAGPTLAVVPTPGGWSVAVRGSGIARPPESWARREASGGPAWRSPFQRMRGGWPSASAAAENPERCPGGSSFRDWAPGGTDPGFLLCFPV